jgi:hypothetical protein
MPYGRAAKRPAGRLGENEIRHPLDKPHGVWYI